MRGMEHLESLIALIQRLQSLHPIGGLPKGPIRQAELSPDFRSLVTSREPWRSQVLAEARWHFAFPRLTGIGMEVRLSAPLVPSAFEDWALSISPVEAELTWSRDMSGQSSDRCTYEIQRIAWEDDAWKVVELWSPRARKSNLAFIEMLNGKGSQEVASNATSLAADPHPDKGASESPSSATAESVLPASAEDSPKASRWRRIGKWLLILGLIWAGTTTSVTVKTRSNHSWVASPGSISESTRVYWVWPGQSFGSSTGMPMMVFGKPLFRLIVPGIWSATISYSEDLSCSAPSEGQGNVVTIYREPIRFYTRTKDLGSTIEVSLGGYFW